MDYYTNKKVLCTGGLGFIGCNLVRALIRQGAQVTILDDLYTGTTDNLIGYVNGIDYKLYVGSVDDYFILDRLIKDTDYIFHLAARNIIASTKDPIKDCETNILGTLYIMLAAKKYNVSRIVYTSSTSVYGNPRYLPINEDDNINLLTPYAVSKYSGEGYCTAFHESYNIPVVMLRLSNVFGPYQYPSNPYCGVVSKFMDKARLRKPIEIHGDGLSTRDFTYVDDVVDSLLLAGSSKKAEGEVFNVATGIETSIQQLAGYISELFQSSLEPSYIDRRDIDNIRRRVLNIEKIRRKLGWMPKTTLYNGLKLTKEWMDVHNH